MQPENFEDARIVLRINENILDQSVGTIIHDFRLLQAFLQLRVEMIRFALIIPKQEK